MSTTPRPPSVDRLARALSEVDLPHALLVEVARAAIAEGPEAWQTEAALQRARQFRQRLLSPVVNATGVLLHTNLGRAPFAFMHD